MSLRLRLTVLTTLIVMAATVALGVIAYLSAARIQYATIDRALSSAVVDVRIKGLTDKPRPVPADVYNPVAVAVVDAAGSTDVLRAAGFGSDPLPFPMLSSEDLSAARSGPITVEGSPSYRVLAAARNGRGDTVVTATPLTSVQQDLARLRLLIVVAVVVVTVLGALLSWLLIRRALRPVDDMVDAAQAIAEGDIDRRVPEARTGTELGDLADALNAMIASLTTSLADVRASENRLRTFVSDASHEIRTPLTVIRGYTELLQQSDEPRSELEQRALVRLDEESRRLDALVTQLLTLERSAAVRPDSVVVFDLSESVTAVFGDFQALHPNRSVTVACQPALMHGSEEAWQQLLTNLTQNLARYTPDGTPVQVFCAPEGDLVRLVVDDAGPGIPEARREEMLQRFTRLDDSRSTESGGTGLGLSIVRSVVETHGGSIVLGESPAGGLRLVITAPRLGAPT
jgi:two-component system OmpR family sensor kinase